MLLRLAFLIEWEFSSKCCFPDTFSAKSLVFKKIENQFIENYRLQIRIQQLHFWLEAMFYASNPHDIDFIVVKFHIFIESSVLLKGLFDQLVRLILFVICYFLFSVTVNALINAKPLLNALLQ